VKILLVEDNEMNRALVRAILARTAEPRLRGAELIEAENVAAALAALARSEYDVILLDVHLPDGSGDAVIHGVAAERPGVRFLALSVSDAAEDVIAVIRAGARGYVTKTISATDLASAIERVAAGDAVFSPRLATFVLDAFRGSEPAAADPELNQLTPREREVLQLIARGYMYKEVAARLHLSVKTVESHVSNVLRKLQLSTRHELARWASQHRLI
jgi:DNA-binding NarL/FixJ family response regulator